MKLRFIASITLFFLLVVVVMSIVLFGPAVLSGASNHSIDASQATTIQSTGTADSVIERENTQVGTESWQISQEKEASTQIQAYAGATSVLPGHKLSFYVSTQMDGMHYSVDIYRLGWYGGAGARLMASQTNLIGHAQGYYNPFNHRLVDCNSCHVETKVGLVEANWQASYTLTVPSDWTTGVYLAKFTDANAMQTYTPFDVKGNFLSRYVVVTSDTTYQAYNTWGGYSLYEADGKGNNASTEQNDLTRGVKVSFDRPYSEAAGSGNILLYDVDAIHWLERQSYDVSYISSVDLHENPSQLLNHRVYISLGHDEYWTKEMRDGVERARNNGVSLAFLGADASYWQMRFGPDSVGTPDRTIICYKVATADNDLRLDPLYSKDNTRVTAQWRDPVLDRPENALIGIMFSGLTHTQQGFPWEIASPAQSPLLKGTGLQAGQKLGCDIVGYEWDRIFNNGATPAGIQVLGTSHTQISDDTPGSTTSTPDISNTTYYIAPSGAIVFATGSIYWTQALDNYRYQVDKLCGDFHPAVPSIQELMAHIMDALVSHHV